MKIEEFSKYFEAEVEDINKVLKEIERLISLMPIEKDNIKLAAAGTFLHNFYNGIENILKRALLVKDIKIQNSPGWHKETLLKAKELNIIDTEIHIKLIPYLTFRHYFIHGYSFKLVSDDILSLLKETDIIFNKFNDAIMKFIREEKKKH
ncbi:MAG: hypothetical protein WC947_04730 [Elusimicrobiota bacterium]